uniref:TPR-like protein n=1 Tax=Kwoniella dejecticola CBS 10117 TaxID=1296121 RepID=A0A1A6AFV3_9TREE|nr:uncharacterized protein I303_00777 [Kwoniella dejecticola CBS 10117]OBR88957.1 hypothetical protein I303_00777 [Kwoniella dejecticola CBS 10117]
MASIGAAATPNPKGAHYNSSLTAALIRGAWAESNPGHAPNKTELSWGELVRKWGKHTGGNTALIHHLRDISLLYLSSTSHAAISSSGYITVPSSQAGLSNEAPGSSNSSNDSGNTGTGSHSSFVHIPHPHLRHRKKSSLDIPQENASTITSGSTIRGDSASTSKASYLSSGDLDGDESDDVRGWAEGNLWWNGISSENVDEVKEGVKSLESLISGGKLSQDELTSARFILAYHLHALGSHEDALRIYEGIDWNAENWFGAVQGDAAVLDRIRARTLQGLSYELAQRPDYAKSIESYLKIIPLLQSLSADSPPMPSYLTNQPSPKLPFEPQREIYRWISTALTRAAVLSSRSPKPSVQDGQRSLRILRTYHAFSSSWPPTFRPIQRQRMLLLHLRSLESSHPLPRQPALESPLLYSTPSAIPARALWKKEVIEIIHNGRNLLQSTTSFPRAGSINRPVTEFTQLAVALYSKCAELSREVISTLWWSMNLTFQSQTILRHLSHLLSDVGDSVDARRIFELYVQLVLKARETQQPEISLQLKRRPTNEDAASPAEIRKQLAEDESSASREQGAESEIDNDKQFIETLLGGTRLLNRDLGEIEEAWRYAVLAGDVLGSSAGAGINDELRARIEEAKGIVRMGMAVHTVDTIERPTYQAQAINHLIAAVELFPSASGYYHLAHCQADARSIDAATQSIRSSLELDSSNVQAWHLLALLLTSRRDWEGALKACEAGISVWEADEEVSASEEDLLNTIDSDVEAKDFAAVQSSTSTDPSQEREQPSEEGHKQILVKDGSFPYLEISPPKTTPLTKSARLEHVIRLRMTLNTIIEKTQGPELAMLKQQELFAFFSARSGKNRNKLGYSSGFGKNTGMKSATSYNSLTALVSPIQPPTPMGEKSVNPISLAEPISDSEKPPINIVSPSPTPSTRQPALAGTSGEEQTEKPRRSLSIRSKNTTKHLHVPTSGGGAVSAPVSRPSSIRRLSSPSASQQQNQSQGQTPNRARSISNSGAQSLAPTAIHSHFRNNQSSSTKRAPPAPPPLSQPHEEHGRTPAESRILSNLWLMSSATFRRWGKLDQCLVAIEEAEVLDPENSDVWIQLGLYHLAVYRSTSPETSPNTNTDTETPEQKDGNPGSTSTLASTLTSTSIQMAESSFVKSILLKPDNPYAIIELSKLYFTHLGKPDLAETLINSLINEKHWDVPHGWYYLGKISESQQRYTKAKECFEFALGLEVTQPIRDWNQVARWL